MSFSHLAPVHVLLLLGSGCLPRQSKGSVASHRHYRQKSRALWPMPRINVRAFAKFDDIYEYPSMRVDKLLSTFGFATRSKSKAFLTDFPVSLLTDPEKHLGPNCRVNPLEVLVGGEPLQHPRPLHIMLNKPVGYVCSHSEDPSIYSLFPPEFQLRAPQLASAGRLDKMASGLLILSQSGLITQKIISPKSHAQKQYLVRLRNDLDLEGKTELEAFTTGNISIRDRKTNQLVFCKPAKLEYVDRRVARVWLTEGKYHQIRRMFATLGNEVVGIHRESIGDVKLDTELQAGEWRMLTSAEISMILNETM
mmetsp:Transcript_29756/g.72491  ORF Transcript_29756/g.72491 Transcript_29756/m.72491 type:complete len:308 (-) Transcript_29756:106-1029(-)|eukprot:CAMPEP_0114491246 /NCGR_PEP_ID=MMETSP0109-20121206/2895_1 /TAXON_ID=29199 /ORGANISM="Chlorarachnion reptans, Strain CCCM449" /LENGTH=307 /DNA_ID=CAMNT_0001667961 /DNA_START=130 /DNA_END=1053 /DNA_ORIENTATION=+